MNAAEVLCPVAPVPLRISGRAVAAIVLVLGALAVQPHLPRPATEPARADAPTGWTADGAGAWATGLAGAPGIDVRVDGSGVAVAGEGWRFGLASATAGVATHTSEGLVQIARGGVTEWYRTVPAGLEQGFTVDRPATDSPVLTLDMAVSGSRPVRLMEGGRGVEATLPGGRTLTYDHLAVVDAAGRVLPSRMALTGPHLSIVVSTAEATWPVRVDPIINVQQDHLFASDGLGSDFFGGSVSVSGDTMVVGAPSDDTAVGADAGSAYVYTRVGTAWTEQAHVFAGFGGVGDFFGGSVSVSGDTMVVGARSDDTVAGADAGSAYVYTRVGSTWTEQAHVFASDGAVGDSLGLSVSVSGNTMVVGAYADDTVGGINAGSAYVYTRVGSTWTQQAHLFASDGLASDFFGASVAVSGDTITAGAFNDATAGGSFAGSAYVYTRVGSTWTQQAHLFASDGLAGDGFGLSVAVAGDTIVVGPNGDDTVAGADAGSAYVYTRVGSTWTEQAHLFAGDGLAGDGFGQSVAVSGDIITVGASSDDTVAGADAGSAYVYTRVGSTWTEQAHVFAGDGLASDFFGRSVAVSGDTLTVGAPADDTAAGIDAGTAYVFVPGGFTVGPAYIVEGNAGTSVDTVLVTLSAPYSVITSVEVHSEAGTATPYSDFLPVHKTISFAPGQTTKAVPVTIFGDTAIEPNEVFGVTLSHASGAPIDNGTGTVTIVNDDVVTVSIADGAAVERNSGSKNLKLALTLSTPSTVATSVKVTTSDGTATAGTDYTAVTKIVTFAPGSLSGSVSVPIFGDTVVEATEMFTLTLSNPNGLTIGDGSATGTITNDD